MANDNKDTAGVPSEPQSFYTQPPPKPPRPAGYQVPSYNPGAPQYADHQGYANPPPPGQPEPPAAGTPAPASVSSGSSHRPGFADRLSALGTKAASPINMLANKMGAEGFLPATMDKECEKAARVIKGFCKHGIYADTGVEKETTEKADKAEKTEKTEKTSGKSGKKSPSPPPKKAKNRTIVTIPAKVIQKAVGLAVFTTARVGFHLSGATGSGVLLARLPDGSWSPPSGIQIHSVGAGFVMGADIYDCVLVLNSREALDAFKRSTRLSLGTDLAVVAGPFGAGGSVDIAAAGAKRDNKEKTQEAAVGDSKSPEGETGFGPPPTEPATPGKQSALRQTLNKAVYSYIKSRGVYAGVQVDGTAVTERQSANTAFYGAPADGAPLTVDRILRGDLPGGNGRWQASVQVLLDAVRGAEGLPAFGTEPQQAAASPYKTEDTLAWANAAPETVINPGSSAYPTAPAHVGPTEADVEQTYVSSDRGVGSAAAGTPAYSKAQEAAAEAAAGQTSRNSVGVPPPAYAEDGPSHSTTAPSELPPAYEEDGRVHPSDSKTGH